MKQRLFAIRLLAIAALLLAACGGGSDGSEGAGGRIGGGTGGTGAGGSGGSNGGTGGTGAGGSQAGGCETALQCKADEVCDPATNQCTAQSLACTVHAECGRAAFCNDQGSCERNRTGGPCDVDERCGGGESCIGGFCGCEGEQFVAEAVPPNVLILLDRSGSMNDRIGRDGPRKWGVAKDAIEELLEQFAGKVNFGISIYPYPDGTPNQCGPGRIEVELGPDTADDILAALDASGPSGNTPIAATLAAAADYDGLKDPTRDNYVLLLTDGDERCIGSGDPDGEHFVTQLREMDPEVKTFVVGFGGGVSPGPLNDMAEAGGTAQSGDPKYYQADNAASLQAAFADIGGQVLSCSYALSGTPVEADDIYIYFDGVAVPRDTTHAKGWDYDSDRNQVTFYGDECESLRAGTVEDLVIVNGCPVVIG